ncbi:MAG: dTDP-4-dehydrorhamnose 3,5-epimerase family protein [Melioribacteraceae bacterium]|nr:dTDP-4-dehydrorhamnose 3,5-epimerase family protein [Melioribacteraceae bacterium]
MEFIKTAFQGLYVIQFNKRTDLRGSFTKVFQRDHFETKGIPCRFAESYYSSSVKNVIRGMHFQMPPFDHYKLVYPVTGKVLDVVLDLRIHSDTYLECFSFELSVDKSNGIYIPKGMAHGFLTLSNESTLVYNTSTVYSPQHDTGILWNSIQFEWRVDHPVISERDKNFISLQEFKTPFYL